MKTPSLTAVIVATCLAALPARTTVILQDDFAYANGSLTNLAAGKWSQHSGTANDCFVTNETLQVSGSLGADVNAPLMSGPYGSGSVAALYAKFMVTFTSLPSSSGTYFAHFKDNSTGFRARVFALTSGAESGFYRLGIANGSGSSSATITTDLSLNTAYTVVVRLMLGANASSTLWLGPSTEASPGVTATDSHGTLSISSFAFRQASGGGVAYVDDLVVGTTFADVVPGSAGSNPPFIVVQPPPSTSVSAGTPVSLRVVAGGDEPLNYQWWKDNALLSGAITNPLMFASPVVADSAAYTVVVGNAAGSITSAVANVTITAVAEPPVITNQPAGGTISLGESITFSVGATGTEPLTYYWYFNGTHVGPNAAFYTVNNATVARSGNYQVIVSNTVGQATSDVAVLTVNPPPTVDIAYLRALVDPVNYLPTNTTTLFTAEGVVTTHANLTSGTGALFYMQDATAGIAVFWTGGAASLPKAGDRVQVVAPLAHFQGLLELYPAVANPLHSVTVISSNNPLPAPVVLDFSLKNNVIAAEALEGSYVVVSNVFADETSPTFVANTTTYITNNLGDDFALFINQYTDIGGQSRPPNPLTILGVLGQYDTSDPRTTGYQLIPSRFADILSSAKLPTFRYTNVLENLVRPGDTTPNTFPENPLRPGEKLTMTVYVSHPDGGTVTITPVDTGLPAGASWTLDQASGTNAQATFRFQPTVGDAGMFYSNALRAVKGSIVATNYCFIYVPSAVEQKILITEFLANPSSSTNSPFYNPLNRSEMPGSISTADEYIEVANLSDTDVDLYNWTVADAVGVRHRFYNGAWGSPPEVLNRQSAIVIYGGPLNGYAPNLPVSAFPASEGTAGLALNNSGNELIILRNGEGHIVDRLAYTGSDVTGTGSISRYPTLNDGFVPQAYIGPKPVSPGAQFDGSAWSQPAPVVSAVSPVQVSLTANTASLTWPALPNAVYTLWRADEITGPFRVVNGVVATNTAGLIEDATGGRARRFYSITTP